ncbi:hypothetical protein Vretifemale_13334 [Volvox reticuliferus]|nr:hypothetical protein Vretifemale_13334 [Volvox reticuliferus]
MRMFAYVGVARYLGTPVAAAATKLRTSPQAAAAAAAAAATAATAPTAAAALMGRKDHQNAAGATAAATEAVLAASESELEALRGVLAVQVTTNRALTEKHLPQAHHIPVLSLQLLRCPSRLYECLSQFDVMLEPMVHYDHPKDSDNTHSCQEHPKLLQKILKKVADSLRSRRVAIIESVGAWALHSVMVLLAKHRQDLILGADRDLLLVPWMPGLGAATEMHEWILHLLREMCDGGPLRRGQQLQPPQQGASNPQNKARKEDQARSGRTAVDATTGAHRQQSSGLEDSRAGKGGGSLGTREGAEVETFMKAAQQGKLPLRADWRIRRRIAMMVSISAMLDLCECEDAGHTLPESAQTMERLKSIKTLVMKTPPLLFVLDCAKGGGDIGILQTKQEVCVD